MFLEQTVPVIYSVMLSVAAYHATFYGHGVKVSYAHNGMPLLQATTNACNEYPDNQSVCAHVCALRTLEVPHWKSMSNVLPIILIEHK